MKILVLLLFLIGTCIAPNKHISQDNNVGPVIESVVSHPNIVGEIAPPNHFERVQGVSPFGKYLRQLKLKPQGSLVKYYNGSIKANNNVYEYVIDLEIGTRDLHQCADAVMRLRAEFLWENERYDEIHFNFTNGFRVDYKEWMKGRRMVVDGNKTYWNDRNQPSNQYKDFWKYMELIFAYAGTASLEKELSEVAIQEAEIGDVLIQGGCPGHAVIIVDRAIHAETGKEIFLLAQSYMPAQELQVLSNPFNRDLSPWYAFDDEEIPTSEWSFNSSDLRSFE